MISLARLLAKKKVITNGTTDGIRGVGIRGVQAHTEAPKESMLTLEYGRL